MSYFVQIIIIFTCLAFMLRAVYLEKKSIKEKNFKDYKPIIISIGILGTFIGIVLGLLPFNEEENITSKDILVLLGGLKIAFITSILGMAISIRMSFYENSKKEGIDNSSNDNPSIKILKEILEEQKEANQEIYSTLSSIKNSSKNILEEQQESNKKNDLIFSSIKNSHESIKINFNKIDESLKKALEVLSKGVTEEIITALKKVISDFNNNLTDQFGDNFKQLNESVKQMIIWQDKYKTYIEETEKNLKLAVNQTKTTADYTEKFATNYEKISITTKDLHQIIETNQNQIKDMETGLKSLKKIGEEAELITKTLDNFSKSIQGSLSEQSEALNQLSRKLIEELGKSLGILEGTLKGLTEKFGKDYNSFLEELRIFVQKARNIEK